MSATLNWPTILSAQPVALSASPLSQMSHSGLDFIQPADTVAPFQRLSPSPLGTPMAQRGGRPTMSKWRLRGSEGPDEGDITSLMGEGTIFNGDLILEGGARIDGKVVGRVITKSVLVVGPCGQVETQELH